MFRGQQNLVFEKSLHNHVFRGNGGLFTARTPFFGRIVCLIFNVRPLHGVSNTWFKLTYLGYLSSYPGMLPNNNITKPAFID